MVSKKDITDMNLEVDRLLVDNERLRAENEELREKCEKLADDLVMAHVQDAKAKRAGKEGV